MSQEKKKCTISHSIARPACLLLAGLLAASASAATRLAAAVDDARLAAPAARTSSWWTALVLSSLLAACGGDRPVPAGGSGQPASGAPLTGAGATFPNPIYAKWFGPLGKPTPTLVPMYAIHGLPE
mgnify:CR=1 FL=1